jgi:hypothetical protein
MKKKIYTIVPDLPPNVNGLGDYAFLLGKKVMENCSVYDIEFIVAGNTAYKYGEFNGFIVHVIKEKNANTLLQLLNSLNVGYIHLHYVGYGYDKRGIPLWLYFALYKWKQKDGNTLLTTFHELFAISKIPWTSSFWNQCLQRLICKKIYLISESIVTSREAFRKYLYKISPFIDIYVYPVFSNFGESNECQNIETRDKGLVILGSLEKRFIIYKKYQKELNIICQKYSIDRIIDIGPKSGKLPLLNVPIIELGVLNVSDISDLLKKNTFGIIGGHKSNQFAKSGIFAAYAAHGIIVFALDTNLTDMEDGLIANQHFITIDSLNINSNKISKSAFYWYNNHCLEKQAFSYTNLFNFYQ